MYPDHYTYSKPKKRREPEKKKPDYSWVWWIVIAVFIASFFIDKGSSKDVSPTPYPTPSHGENPKYNSYSMTAQADLTMSAPDNFPDPPGYGDASGSSASCDIKGNISMSGEKIYHVPGQKYYDATVIDESYGERWFCTEEEARAAGWRKARN